MTSTRRPKILYEPTQPLARLAALVKESQRLGYVHLAARLGCTAAEADAVCVRGVASPQLRDSVVAAASALLTVRSERTTAWMQDPASDPNLDAAVRAPFVDANPLRRLRRQRRVGASAAAAILGMSRQRLHVLESGDGVGVAALAAVAALATATATTS